LAGFLVLSTVKVGNRGGTFVSLWPKAGSLQIIEDVGAEDREVANLKNSGVMRPIPLPITILSGGETTMTMNLRTMLLLAGVLSIVSSPCAWAHTDVTVEEARDLIASTSDLTVVDVREPYEYCDARGHIPGALNYPWSSGVLEVRYEELPADGPILVVCRSGGRSNAAASFLDSEGFQEVYDMLRGMSAWQWETAPCKYSGGAGTADDPYQIATAADLIALGETPEDYDKHFVLTADIDLDPNLPGRKVFDRAVIAPDTNNVADNFQGTAFTGVFDGNGHTILHLRITGGGYLGLFGQLGYPASISNLGLEGAEVSGAAACVGGLLGCNYRGSIVSGYSTGTVSGTSDVGGLVGYNEWGHIADSYSSAVASGEYYVGGLVGTGQMGSISSSYSTGMVSGGSTVGGLVGEINGGSIVWSYSTGSVSGTGREVGGLVGYDYWGLITTSYSTGSVTGRDSVGGLVGRTNGGCRIVSSYSTGAVSGMSDVGGLVGTYFRRSSIDSSYSNGWVTGTGDVGGLIGRDYPADPDYEDSINLSFWDIQVSGQANSDGGIAKTTAQMTDIQTFLDAGWDFETVWMMPVGDYPRIERREPEAPGPDGWVRLSPMKMARDQFAGGIIGDEIFVFGGNAMGGKDLYTGEKYNIVTDTWSDIADNPHYEHPHEQWLGQGVEELSGIGFNGKFYVFGADELNYNEMYDPDTNTWTTFAKKPTRTAGTVPVLYGGKMYFFGGYIGDGMATRTVEIYDPELDTWQEDVSNMPRALSSHSVAVHDHFAYIIGGGDEEVGAMNDVVMRYAFKTNTWTRDYCIAPPEAARVYAYATQAPVINGKIYLIGGIQAESRGTDWAVDTFTIFDIELKEWDSGPALPKPRTSHLTVISDNVIYVIGGKNVVRGGEIELDNAKDTVLELRLPGSP
jgi:rhodanese-related sulfurtransferase